MPSYIDNNHYTKQPSETIWILIKQNKEVKRGYDDIDLVVVAVYFYIFTNLLRNSMVLRASPNQQLTTFISIILVFIQLVLVFTMN